MSSPNAREVHLQVIREALEGIVQPQLASAALFEAVTHYEPEELADRETMNTLVTMHLHDALAKRVGADEADAAIEHISGLLKMILSKPEPLLEEERNTLEFEAHSTLEITRGTGPVQLVVCAVGSRLAAHLSSAVGETRLITATVRDAYEAQIVVEGMEPDIFLFDGANLPPDSPDKLARAVKKASSNMWIVVWSTDMPEERKLLDALNNLDVNVTSFDREEGVDPLLDLIRSRARQSFA